jgi:hypothetical protein
MQTCSIYAHNEGKKLSGVMCRSGSNFQAVPIPDGTFTVVMSHLEILGQFETIRGASVLAQSAEHAARSVVSECGQNFSPCGVVPQPSHHNQVFRAGQRTQIAGNAQRFARLRIHIQTRCATIALRDHRPFLGILFGCNVLGSLVAKGQHHAFYQVPQKDAFQKFFHCM